MANVVLMTPKEASLQPARTLALDDRPLGHSRVLPPFSRNEALFRLMVAVIGLCLCALFFGFVLFASMVMRDPAPMVGQADGILVLTGGDFRILEGAKLLREGRARHMLISGVNAKTSRDDLLKLTGLTTQLFDCCVELGYAAQDTVGNAEEALTWATTRKMTRLIVVTSSYHMLRSMAELSLRMPDVDFVPDPVVPRTFRARAWWLHFGATRIMISEYLKYLPVAARLAILRYFAPGIASPPTIGQPTAGTKS